MVVRLPWCREFVKFERDAEAGAVCVVVSLDVGTQLASPVVRGALSMLAGLLFIIIGVISVLRESG